jgi:hypothetical protein
MESFQSNMWIEIIQIDDKDYSNLSFSTKDKSDKKEILNAEDL